MTEMASKMLEDSLEKLVLVRLRGGRSIRGKLKGFDQHMNLVLEDAEEASDNENIEKIGTMIVRGDNVIIVSPSPR